MKNEKIRIGNETASIITVFRCDGRHFTDRPAGRLYEAFIEIMPETIYNESRGHSIRNYINETKNQERR